MPVPPHDVPPRRRLADGGLAHGPARAYRVVAGRPASHRSSAQAIRTFCGTCGTPLTFESTRYPDETDVTMCSLDDPEQVPPQDHTRAATKLSWVKLADGLPVYPEQRTKT